MQTDPSTRTWLSPLIGVAFLVIEVTGILMLFHVRLPGMTFLHEMGGLLFVVLAVLHLPPVALSACYSTVGSVTV